MLTPMPWVYVAGPYTNGDTVLHVRNSVRVAEFMHTEGFVPLVPHLTHLWHLISPHEVDFWYDLDLHHLQRCDCLIRLPGQSTGADREVRQAEKLGIPVVFLSDLSDESIEFAARDLMSRVQHKEQP